MTVKMNFLSENNKVSVHLNKVQGCTTFVNNIHADVFSPRIFSTIVTSQYPTMHL